MSVERSDKLKWQVYEPSVYEAPYLVYYMKQSSDSYTSSGYSFNIKTPALGAFLDPEAYISYKIRIRPNAPGKLAALFRMYGIATDVTAANDSLFPDPASRNNNGMNPRIDNADAAQGNPDYGFSGQGGSEKFAFRQGNVFQRATQQIVLTINGFTLNAEPWKWVDIMNRIMVSKEQSKHIFSGSGGAFDSGNHGLRNEINNQAIMIPEIPITGGYRGVNTAPITVIPAAAIYQSGISQGFNFSVKGNNPLTGAAAGGTLGSDYVYIVPQNERFMNPGLSDRIWDMIRKCRGDFRDDVTTGYSDNVNAIFPNSLASDGGGYKYFSETGNTNVILANQPNGYYDFLVWEPIPLPPFKMYHNDGIGGIIPHVRDMTLRSTFTANLLNNLFSATYDVENAYKNNYYGGFYIDWSAVGVSNCQIFMKWYLPPPAIQIPREISIPLRKYDMYLSTSAGGIDHPIGSINSYAQGEVAQYNISLDAVPDLLLIYYRIRNDIVKTYHPCDYLCEISNLTIQLENNGGKLTQMQTYQMYQNWLKYIKFDDPVEMTYDEWRKYCCVACLKPDDYGIIRGPGWDNVVVLGVTFTARNWHNNPSINLCGPENLSNNTAGFGSAVVDTVVVSSTYQTLELVVTAVFDRWHLTLSADGTARANLTRIRDLGNALPSAMMPGGPVSMT